MTNNTLDILAGSETFTYALAVELQRRGHQVQCFSRRLGLVAHKLAEKGIPSFGSLEAVSQPDVIHAHHAVGAEAAVKLGVPAVYVSHGLIPQERPTRPFNKLVAVSEEVKESLDPFRVDALIRNSVDVERFGYSSERPKTVLLVSNYATGREAAMVERAAKANGYGFHCVGRRFGFQSWPIEEEFAKASIVVGLGRTVLEAMAMGRSAIVFDAGHPLRGVPQLRGDGLITPETYPEIRRHNFSGRRWNRVRDWQALAAEMAKATPKNGDWGAKIVREEHDIRKAAERYEALYREIAA